MKKDRIPSVLIVDDDALSRDLLVRGLEKYGYVVTVAESGKQAIKIFKVQQFDVVLLDINMPDVNGIEVLEQIKGSSKKINAKVIMMSAENDADIIRHCKFAGATDYLLKPLTLSGVVKRLDHHLGDDFSPSYQQATGMPNKSARILVVDDEVLNRDVLERRLKKMGYSVVLAESAAEGYKILQQHSIDLILLDIMMPEVDGIDMLKKIKEAPQFKLIPVIMLTAQSDKDSVTRCVELGAEAYLLKPFDAKQLEIRIEESLQKES